MVWQEKQVSQMVSQHDNYGTAYHTELLIVKSESDFFYSGNIFQSRDHFYKQWR